MSNLFFKGLDLIHLGKFKGKVYMACPNCNRTRRIDEYMIYEVESEIGTFKYYKCCNCRKTVAFKVDLRGEVYPIKVEGKIV